MKIIPTFKCKDIKASIAFYKNVLGLEVSFIDKSFFFASIQKEGCEIHLERHNSNASSLGIAYILVDEVDSLFQSFIKNGLNNSHKKNSPLHQGPMDQTWGMREFYVDDPNGNTLRFGCPIK